MNDKPRTPWEEAFKEENGRYPNDLDRLAKSDADTRNLLRNMMAKMDALEAKIDQLLKRLDP